MNRTNRLLLFVTLFVLGGAHLGVRAQDKVPAHAPKSLRLKRVKPFREVPTAADTIAVRDSFPRSFRGVRQSVIQDSLGILNPIFLRLNEVYAGANQDTVRILHIGDSHVRGHIYPQTMGHKLVQIFKALKYTDMGVNGATCLTFTHPDRMAEIIAYRPELLILSFGTNESHNRSYRANVHYHQMDELLSQLRDSLPGVPILLTTPPGSYERLRYRRRKGRYTVNPRTETAAGSITKYARDHRLVVWDLYRTVGGRRYACENWTKARLMRPDHVHYVAEGYVLQGELFYRAFIKAYNRYVISR